MKAEEIIGKKTKTKNPTIEQKSKKKKKNAFFCRAILKLTSY